MSRIITQSLEAGLQRAFSLADAFIKACPDEVWAQKFGAWPVWQQLHHPFASVDFFLRAENAAPEAALFEPGVAELKTIPRETPEKSLIHDSASKAQAKVRDYAAGLDDVRLGELNTGLSGRLGRDMTHAATLALIASHLMYHLGACDAALREQGLPGVF